MTRTAFTTAAMAALLLCAGAASADEPATAPAAVAPKPHWVGAMVIDNKGEEVGTIDRLVPAMNGVHAEIVIRGHRSSVALKTLTMGADGKAVSTMTKEEIRRTYAS
jgi:hypothetical protein